MSLILSNEFIKATQTPGLDHFRRFLSRGDGETVVDVSRLDDADLREIIAVANEIGDGKIVRTVDAILTARQGEFTKAIPNFKAFQGILEAFLRHDLIDGWIYVTSGDGKIYPELVTNVRYDSGRGRGDSADAPTVIIETVCYGHGRTTHAFGMRNQKHIFSPSDVTRKRVADALGAAGLLHETPALKEAYLASFARHRELVEDGFAQQFVVDGSVSEFEDRGYGRRDSILGRRKVIHDLARSDYGAAVSFCGSVLLETKNEEGVGQVPEHPVVRVFDLASHEFYWVHSDYMTPYAFDKSLRDKLVLPQSHRDLLDILTQDLGAFTGDVIEGKSAGNTILCKGIPGVGKTLTAEVYAELIESPLYSVHSGTLGTRADVIDKNLRRVFQQAKRWNCVLLLDEADVFVMTRGASIEQNAIVADFLRTLEYFDGLMFMTTNRADEIDDAIISRCLAIIGYAAPGRADATRVWRVMAALNDVELSDGLIGELLDLFPTITPRDVKMLLRLTLRVAAGRKEALSIETFRRCAMFRAIEMSA